MSTISQPLMGSHTGMALVRDYSELVKARVTTLIVITAWCGYYFGASRAQVTGTPHDSHIVGPGNHWLDGTAYAQPAAFTFGNAGRNTVRGPRLSKADIALERKFPLREQTQLGFRAEVFNLFNHTNFDTPNRFVNTPQFGSVTMAATSSRQVQFGLKLIF